MAPEPTSVVFESVPLPPTSNTQYRSFMRHGKIIHVSAPELVRFKRDLNHYFFLQSKMVGFARELFPGHPLSVHIDFMFEKSRLIAKKGHFKRLDVSNRLKAIHDGLALALGIDDSMFVRISAAKHAVKPPYKEGATITVSLCDFVQYGVE